MARIRTIKPSFWADGAVAAMSRDARLLCIGLISFSDDQGRFVASIPAITGYIYPHDEVTSRQVRSWLAEVEKAGLISLYEVDGLRYGWFPKYRTHQRISHPQPSPLPPPQEVLFQ